MQQTTTPAKMITHVILATYVYQHDKFKITDFNTIHPANHQSMFKSRKFYLKDQSFDISSSSGIFSSIFQTRVW